jgi:hypothetical protein
MNKKIPGITKKIRRVLVRYPNSSPKAIAEMLFRDRLVEQTFEKERDFYQRYKGLISTEKWAWNKWLKTEEKGRVLKSLKSGSARLLDKHKVSWSFEVPFPQSLMDKIGEVAGKQRPGIRDHKPLNAWYIIPNRNRQREYHSDNLTMRLFPVSGTVVILPGYLMPFKYLRVYVEEALFRGGLSLGESEEWSKKIIPGNKSRTFHIGRVDPFKIDFYKESLGLELGADGSHPRYLEAKETFPAWVKVFVDANREMAQSNKELALNLKTHISALKGIDSSVQSLEATIKKFARILGKLERRL